MYSMLMYVWRKLAGKTNDPFHWNGYRFFRQEVKREIRVAEKVHVRTQILDSNGNSNSIWKIINQCLPRKQQDSFMACEDPTGLANELIWVCNWMGQIRHWLCGLGLL